jgi:uncharacterized membrane protein YiaA
MAEVADRGDGTFLVVADKRHNAAHLLGLWNAEMQLNEKGYYFAVLVLGLFSAASYQKTVRDKYEGIPTTSIYYMTCLTVFIISVALLMVGLWNATLLLSEKGFYYLSRDII